MPQDATNPIAQALADIFVHLTGDAVATPYPVTPEFWSKTAPALPIGWLVSTYETSKNWPSWEMHPAGDEFVYQLSGSKMLILELAEGQHQIRLEPGQFAVVPRGIWHSADMIVPGSALYVTAGAGTRHRPR